VEGVRALPPEKMFRQHIQTTSFYNKKIFARNIGKIDGKVIGGWITTIFLKGHLANRSAKGRKKVVREVVVKSSATINPIILSNNTSIIHLNSHSKCIVNGHSYQADRICQ